MAEQKYRKVYVDVFALMRRDAILLPNANCHQNGSAGTQFPAGASHNSRPRWDVIPGQFTKILYNGSTSSLQEESNIEEVQTWTTNES